MTQSIILLGKDEEWFWATELRIVWNLLTEAQKLKKIEQKNQAAYIAMCVWGKLPKDEEIETNNGDMPGRDIPLDPAMLKGFV